MDKQNHGSSVKQAFDLSGKVAVITGGAGLLGVKHGEAIAEMGGIIVVLDLSQDAAEKAAMEIGKKYKTKSLGLACDITSEVAISAALGQIVSKFGRVDILINNAANNPKVEGAQGSQWTRLENFPLKVWEDDIRVGLTGAYLCSKIIGAQIAKKGGVILNVSSDLGLIGPDQRIYRKEGVAEEQQFVKPVTYSVVKSGLIGLTRWLATYWADKGVRVNSITPGGVANNQDPAFVKKLTNLIPLGRMAGKDEYKAAVVFLVSDASSYMTGANLVIEGGRTAW